jgi:hypothetical protein
VASAIDRTEERIREVVPIAQMIYLEPDILENKQASPDEG